MERDETFEEIFTAAARIIAHLSYEGLFGHGEHRWHRILQQCHALHPVIVHILCEGVRPVDWQQLLFEWPAVSNEDESLLAYTRDEAKGEAEVRTRTSVGKYLSRHWPHVPDHIRRDWAGRFVPAIYKIDTTKEGIIAGIELGPRSCMQSAYGTIPFDGGAQKMLLAFLGLTTHARADHDAVPWDHHPYAVYAPEHGWGMATRNDPGQPQIVLGRALVLDTELNGKSHKGFVRSYCRNPNGDAESSGSDEKLEAWLDDRGFTHWESWPDGVRLRKVAHPHGGGHMAPYIDGGVKGVEEEGIYLVICRGGTYTCDNTDGTVDGGEELYGACSCCDSDVHEDDDFIWAGRDEETLVGACCREKYMYVRGAPRRGQTMSYYVHEDDVVEVGGEYYDGEHLPEYIVECKDGEYRHQDDVIYVDDEYYSVDDERIVECEDGEHRLKEDCWKCEHSGQWYSDDVEGVDLNGKYHPDALRELADEHE